MGNRGLVVLVLVIIFTAFLASFFRGDVTGNLIKGTSMTLTNPNYISGNIQLKPSVGPIQNAAPSYSAPTTCQWYWLGLFPPYKWYPMGKYINQFMVTSNMYVCTQGLQSHYFKTSCNAGYGYTMSSINYYECSLNPFGGSSRTSSPSGQVQPTNG